MHIYHHLLETPLGTMELVGNERGVTGLSWPDVACKTEDPEVVSVLSDDAPRWMAELVEDIPQWFANPHDFKAYPLIPDGTPFQKEVWGIIQTIPVGQTRTYSDIAQELGRPQSHRAVATACGANYSGHASGYRWGTWRKEKLLEAEKNSFV